MHSSIKTSIICNREPKEQNLKLSLDALGIIASCICLIHCMILPLLVLALPIIGIPFLEADWTHKLLAFFVVMFALWSVLPSYFKHRNAYVLSNMISGLALVLFATFASEKLLGKTWEVPLISVGNAIVVLTHLRNRKLCVHQSIEISTAVLPVKHGHLR